MADDPLRPPLPRSRRLAAQALAYSMGLLLPLAVLEAGARIHEALRTRPYPLDEWLYLESRPPPYADADFFGSEFMREARTSLRSAVGAKDGFMGIGTFEGRYVNIAQGQRVTTDQPTQASGRLLVFGGSTMFSRRVPDSMTIPSQLQRLVNRHIDEPRLVVNFGSPGVTTSTQLTILKRLGIAPGDIVVFYDGFNDVFNPIYRLRQSGAGETSGTEVVGELSEARRRLQETLLWLGRHSALARLVSDLDFVVSSGHTAESASTGLPSGVDSADQIERIHSAVGEEYHRLLVDAHQYVSERGGRFYHFLQPNLFIQTTRSSHEARVIETESVRYPGLELAVRLGYPKLREATRSARADGVASVDLTGALTDREYGGEVYFDRAHVNHHANGIIARRMFDTIFTAGGEGDPGS